MAASSTYVFLDDLRYSPKKMTAQTVLTSGSACSHNTKSCAYQLATRNRNPVAVTYSS